MASVQPQVVVTIHGIQTTGEWQKNITPYLAREGLIPYHIDFGWFDALRFLFKPTRERKVGLVRDELRTLVANAGVRRVSVIAHSFGTYLAMEALVRENGDLRYDRVVLTGCILPRTFDWKRVVNDKLVMAVRNERATSDWVVGLALWASSGWRRFITRLDAGDAGSQAFWTKLPEVIDSSIDAGHSGTHNPTQYMRWARFVSYPRLSGENLEKTHTELQLLRQNAAKLLNRPVDTIRVNLFAPLSGKLRIVPGAHDNMTYAPELDLEIETGHGGTGTAFQTNTACVVTGNGQDWSYNLPGDQLARINPRLRWIVSLPVKSKTRNIMIGVVNVDGLDDVPAALADPLGDEAKSAVLSLQGLALPKITDYLDKAFRGELLDQVEA